jgi:hypothetical protein
MKTQIIGMAVVMLGVPYILAQTASAPQPQQPPPAVQAPPCTPPEVYQHLHPESSKPLIKILGRLNKQIDKATGGTLSGPTVEDVRKTLPPPCPVTSAPQRGVIK